MTDELLRGLERSAATDPTARVPYARALQRAGRHDDARAVLLAALDSAEARSEVAAFPCWSHPGGDAGWTNFLDATGIGARPTRMWSRELDDSFAGAPFPAPALLASPLGLVCSSGPPENQMVVVEPATGAVHFGIRNARGLLLARDTLVVGRPDRLDGLDLWTGEARFRLPFPGGTPVWGAWSSGRLAVMGSDGIHAFGFEDHRVEPEPLWSRSHDGRAPILLAGGRLFVEAQGGFVALSVDDGAELWRAQRRAVAADERGVLAYDDDDGVTVFLAPDGRVSWQAEVSNGGIALRPDGVVLCGHGEGLELLDRETRDVRWAQDTCSILGAAARDWLLVDNCLDQGPHDGFGLLGLDHVGEVRWRVHEQDLGGDVRTIALLAGRAFVLAGRTLHCFA